MTTYVVEYDIYVRYRCRVSADSPEEAIKQFWVEFENDGLNEAEAGSFGPYGLSMTDLAGNPVAWGPRIDLS